MTDRYADWDAAYVLGTLDPVERREYAAHLVGCEACRNAVADLAALPGLLASVPPDSLPWPAAPPAEPVETTPPTTSVVEPVETTPPTTPPAEPVETTPPTTPVVEPVETTPPVRDGPAPLDQRTGHPDGAPSARTRTPHQPTTTSGGVVPLARVAANARQSRLRRRAGLTVAAAVVAAGGVVAGAAFGPDLTAGPTSPPTSTTRSVPQAVPLELSPVTGAGMRADLVATPTPWGTRFEWSCRYDRPPGVTPVPDAGYGGSADGGAPEPVTYELVLVDRRGARVVAATWTTASQEATGLAASSSLPLGSLARIEIGVVGREEPLASATL